MADVKISALPAATSVAAADVAPIVQGGTTKKASAALFGAAAGQAGAGSPEGVVTAVPGVPYWDTTAKSLWIKDTGTGNTGWVQVVA